MEEIQQVPNQNPITPAPPIATYPTSQPAPTSKTPWIYIAVIVVLLGIASYFGYQNYQFKQQISLQQSTPSSSAMVVSSPLSTATQVASNISTEKWKTFKNDNFSYSLKYPDIWKTVPTVIEGSKNEAIGLHAPELSGKTVYLHANYPSNPTMPFLQIEVSTNETQVSYNTRKQSRSSSQEVTINGYPANLSKQKSVPEPGTSFNKEGVLYSWFIYNSKLNAIYDISCAEDKASVDLCNQAMSTFKFTE